jgi:hypothetical protein
MRYYKPTASNAPPAALVTPQDRSSTIPALVIQYTIQYKMGLVRARGGLLTALSSS